MPMVLAFLRFWNKWDRYNRSWNLNGQLENHQYELHESFLCHGDPGTLTGPNSAVYVLFWMPNSCIYLSLSLLIFLLFLVYDYWVVVNFYSRTFTVLKDASKSWQFQIIMQPITCFSILSLWLLSDRWYLLMNIVSVDVSESWQFQFIMQQKTCNRVVKIKCTRKNSKLTFCVANCTDSTICYS